MTVRRSVRHDLTKVNAVARQIVVRRMSQLGRRIEANAKQRAPVRTGNLRRSIGHRVERSGRREVRLEVFATVSYAQMVHDGTGPHIIRPRNSGGVLRFFVDGQPVFAKYVRHPGTKARPFLRLAAIEEARRL